MTTRYILRKQGKSSIIPLPHLGLFCGRRLARVAAKEQGYPLNLIAKVTRHERCT